MDRRQFNEDRSRLFGTDGRIVAFVCECADPDCRQTVALTAQQADAVRAAYGSILVPGHRALLEPSRDQLGAEERRESDGALGEQAPG